MHGDLRTAFLFFILVSFLLPASSQAETVWYLENGTPVRAGQGFTNDILATADTEGYTLVVWRDGRNGDLNLYGQLCDNNTALPVWTENGILLASAPGLQELADVIAVDGGFILTWLDARNSDNKTVAGDLYAQKVNLDGDLLWQEDDQPASAGIPIAAMENEQAIVDPFLVRSLNGGCFVGYGRAYPGSGHIEELIIERRTGTGETAPGWPVDGIILDGSPPEGQLEVTAGASDGSGGAFLTWFKVPYPDAEIRTARILPDGTLPWNGGQPLILSNPGTFSQDPAVVVDGTGGAFYCWTELTQGRTIRMQRVDAAGTPLWEDGGAIIATANDPAHAILRRHAPGTVVLAWTESINFLLEGLIQRFTGQTEPTPMWGTDPINFASVPVDLQDMLVDSDGNTIVLYEDDDTDALLLQHFNSDGYPQHYGNGDFLLSGDDHLYASTMLTRMASGVAFAYPAVVGGAEHIFIQRYQSINQETYDPTPLTTGITGGVTEYTTVATQDAVYTVWLDNRQVSDLDVGPGLMVQALDRDTGAELFASNGIPLLPAGGGSYDGSDDVSLILSADGNLFAAANYAGDAIGLCLQKFTPQGDLLWGNSGKVYEPDAGIGYTVENYQMTATDDGGFIILFDNFFSQSMAAQRFNEFGHPVWTDQVSNFIELPPSGSIVELQSHVTLPGGDILYLATGYNYPLANLWLNRITQDGESPWADPVNISDADVTEAAMTLTAQGVLISWEEHPSTYKAQLYSVNGAPVWPEAVELVDYDYNTPFQIVALPDETDAFWVVTRTTGNFIAVQRRSLQDGQPLLGDDPIFLNTGWDVNHVHLKDDAAVAMDDGGLMVTWSRELAGEDVQRIVYRRINADGSFPAGYPEPQVLAETLGDQHEPRLIPDGFGGAYVHWLDRRASAGLQFNHHRDQLYVHRIHDDITGVELEPSAASPNDWALGAAYPNPFNAATTVTVTLPRATDLTVAVFDVLGRQVAVLRDGVAPAGTHRIGVDASDWASGLYFLRATVAGDSPRTRKLVVLK